MGPDGEDVIYEPPPHSRFNVLSPQELAFQLSHEYIGIERCHPSSNSCSEGAIRVPTVTGTRMAPSYANILMGKLERKFLLTQDIEPQVWWRFIDNIFAIWTHGEQVLCRFIESLNRHHPTIKFTTT